MSGTALADLDPGEASRQQNPQIPQRHSHATLGGREIGPRHMEKNG